MASIGGMFKRDEVKEEVVATQPPRLRALGADEVAVCKVIGRDGLLKGYESFNRWGVSLADALARRVPAGVTVLPTSGIRGPVVPWLYDAEDRELWLESVSGLLGKVMWIAPSPVEPGVYGNITVKDHRRHVDRLVFDLLDEKPAAIVGTTAVLYSLAARNCEWLPERVYVTGDKFKPSHRKAVIGHFKRIGAVYSGAWGVVGASCTRGVWHMDSARWTIEMVDTQSEGEGWSAEALGLVRITPRASRSMLVPRCELGDYFEPLVGQCGCGVPGITVSGVEGRIEDVWRLPSASGRAKTVDIYPMLLERAVEAADDRIRDYELTLLSREKATMRLVLPGFDMRLLTDTVLTRIRDVCEKRGATMPKVTWIWKPPAIRGKRRLVAGFWDETDQHGQHGAV